MKRLIIAAATLPLLLGGCANLLDRAMDAASDRAGNIIGNAIGDRVGTAIAGQTMVAMDQLTPELTQAYAMSLFSVLYYHGGYAWEGKAYQPGEYTQWEGDNVPQGDFFEKAFLKREPNKQEWWRVRVQSHEDGQVKEAVFEALFSTPGKNGEQHILRMRAKLPNQAQGSEVPITAENRDSWVLRPQQRLTAESLKGAQVGVEQVAVAAGRYQTRHVRYMHGSGQVDWWLSDQVPGGVVKYTLSGTSDKGKQDSATMQLRSVGKGAKPMLL